MYAGSFRNLCDDVGQEAEESTVEASLVDGAGGNIGSGSRDTDAEGPAGHGDLCTALGLALLEFGLAARGVLALFVLVWASLLDALFQVALGEDCSNEDEEEQDDSHGCRIIIILGLLTHL